MTKTFWKVFSIILRANFVSRKMFWLDRDRCQQKRFEEKCQVVVSKKHIWPKLDLIEWKKVGMPSERSSAGCNWLKQWLLAGEFSEFKYSRETRRFWRVRVLAKTAVFWNMRDSPDSPTFAKPCCTDSPDSPTFAKSCCADSPDSPTFAKLVARTRQTRERRVWQVLREFSESGESGEFGECRLDRFMHIKYVICA